MTHGWLRSGYRLNPFSLPLLSSSTSESKSICILSEEDDKREEKDICWPLFRWSFVCLEAVSRILSRKKNSNGSLLSNTQIKRPSDILPSGNRLSLVRKSSPKNISKEQRGLTSDYKRFPLPSSSSFQHKINSILFLFWYVGRKVEEDNNFTAYHLRIKKKLAKSAFSQINPQW